MKLQFDYAWKWFSFHAEQRTKMFNFMLVAMGIFATATVGALNNHLPDVAVALCVISAGAALSFTRLDRRNQDLLRLGEGILVRLERSHIFGEAETFSDRDENRIAYGILWREKREEKGLLASLICTPWQGKHRFWLPAIAIVLAAAFLAAAYWIHQHAAAFLPKP